MTGNNCFNRAQAMNTDARIEEFATLESRIRKLEAELKDMKELKDDLARGIFQDLGTDCFQVESHDGMKYSVTLNETLKHDLEEAEAEYPEIKELAIEKIQAEPITQTMVNALIKVKTKIKKAGKSKEAYAKELEAAKAWLNEFDAKVTNHIETKVVVREIAKTMEDE